MVIEIRPVNVTEISLLKIRGGVLCFWTIVSFQPDGIGQKHMLEYNVILFLCIMKISVNGLFGATCRSI